MADINIAITKWLLWRRGRLLELQRLLGSLYFEERERVRGEVGSTVVGVGWCRAGGAFMFQILVTESALLL